MNEFRHALTSAFGTGPAAVPGLTVDRLDGRRTAEPGAVRMCVACFGDTSVSPCKDELPPISR